MSSPKATWQVGPAAAQRVVVDRRQVVVDQRVRVDELERGGRGQHRRGIGAAAARRGQREHRADALAAGEQRVAHRLHEARGAPVGAEVERPRGTPRRARADRRGTAAPARRPTIAAASAGDATEPLEEASRLLDQLGRVLQQRHLDLARRRRRDRRGSSSSSCPRMARTRAIASAGLSGAASADRLLSHRRSISPSPLPPRSPLCAARPRMPLTNDAGLVGGVALGQTHGLVDGDLRRRRRRSRSPRAAGAGCCAPAAPCAPATSRWSAARAPRRAPRAAPARPGPRRP